MCDDAASQFPPRPGNRPEISGFLSEMLKCSSNTAPESSGYRIRGHARQDARCTAATLPKPPQSKEARVLSLKNALFALARSRSPRPPLSAAGQYGLGCFPAPVGGRVWFTDKVAGDVGIGFRPSADGGDTQSALIDAGSSPAAAESGNAVSCAWRDVRLRSRSHRLRPTADNSVPICERSSESSILHGPHFSVQGHAHGVRSSARIRDKVGNTTATGFTSEAFGLSNITGFPHFSGGSSSTVESRPGSDLRREGEERSSPFVRFTPLRMRDRQRFHASSSPDSASASNGLGVPAFWESLRLRTLRHRP